MPYRHGAIHNPDASELDFALDFRDVRVGGVVKPTDWFQAWNWQSPPDTDILANDDIGDCCPVADYRLVQAWLAAQGVNWPIDVELVKMRYTAVAAWQGTRETDIGTVTQADCFAWQSAGIFANGQTFNTRWLTVKPIDVPAALRRGPLLLTLGLTEADADYPETWNHAPSSPITLYHRVVAGAEKNGLLDCHTYGIRKLVHPARIVAADLMVHTEGPSDLRTAGLDWNAITA